MVDLTKLPCHEGMRLLFHPFIQFAYGLVLAIFAILEQIQSAPFSVDTWRTFTAIALSVSGMLAVIHVWYLCFPPTEDKKENGTIVERVILPALSWLHVSILIFAFVEIALLFRAEDHPREGYAPTLPTGTFDFFDVRKILFTKTIQMAAFVAALEAYVFVWILRYENQEGVRFTPVKT